MTERPNYNLKRFQARNIATLKKEYGGDVTVYQLTPGSATTNRDSGAKSATYTSFEVQRAVVMPVHAMRHVIQTISIISANKKLVQGGSFDAGDRVFLIDRNDLPTSYEMKKNDWIEYEGDRYDIKYFDEYEPLTSWLVLGKVITGVTPELHKRTSSRDLLGITDTVSVVKV